MPSTNQPLWAVVAVACVVQPIRANPESELEPRGLLAAVQPALAAAEDDAELRGLRAVVQPSDFVIPAGQSFQLEGRPLRLWGIALRGAPPLTRPLPDDAEPETDPPASAFLRRLKTQGVGFLRLDIPSAEDPDEAARRLAIDRVLARSRAHGIYVWLGASHMLGTVTSNDVVVLDDPASAASWAESFASLPGGRLPLDGSLARAWDPRLELLESQSLAQCASHFNPVTGRRWSEDPAIVLWELEGPDGWHARMRAGEEKTLPTASRSLLDAQFDHWLFQRYGDDEPDPLPPEEWTAFLADLWSEHKRRVANKFRLGGIGIRQAALAWRETAEPEAMGDESGVFALYSRPAAITGTAVPDGDLAVLRISLPAADPAARHSPETPWRVLAASGRFAAVAWDADLPTNAAPTAFQAAFAAAGDLFRAGVREPAPAPTAKPEGDVVSLSHPAFLWRRADSARALALGNGPDAPLLALPGEASALAAAVVRGDPVRRTVYAAVEPAADAALVLPATAAEDDRFWGRLPLAYTIRGLSGDKLDGGTVETLPQRIPLPAGTFRVDFAPAATPGR